MQSVAREVPGSIRRKIVVDNVVLTSIIVAVVWLLAVVLPLCGINLVRRDGAQKHLWVDLSIAVSFTIVGVGFAIYQIRRSLYLVRFGVAITGTIESVVKPLPPISAGEFAKVFVRYSFGGQEYVEATSSPLHLAVGEPVGLFVDPRKPQRFAFNYELLPGVKPPLKKDDVSKWWRWVLLAVFLGLAAVFFHWDMANDEAQGRVPNFSSHVLTNWYKLTGKWGITAPLGVMSIATFFVALSDPKEHLASKSAESSEASDPDRE